MASPSSSLGYPGAVRILSTPVREFQGRQGFIYYIIINNNIFKHIHCAPVLRGHDRRYLIVYIYIELFHYAIKVYHTSPLEGSHERRQRTLRRYNITTIVMYRSAVYPPHTYRFIT